jgi:Zn-dependent peptidase ImmA (M78 family)
MGKIAISSIVLRHARTSLKKSQEEAAVPLGITKDQLVEMENQSENVEVSYSMLKRLSNTYKRPLAFFLMNNIPRKLEPENDFRTLESVRVDDFDTQMALVLREAQSTRRKYARLLNDLDVKYELNLPALDPSKDIQHQAAALRDAVGIDIQTQLAWGTDHRLARYRWQEAIEGKGVLILSHIFDVEEIRGFALSGHNLPPALVFNSQDDVRASIFTIIHELAHILLNTDKHLGHKKIEKFCNSIAANFLVPDESFKKHAFYKKIELAIEKLGEDEGKSFDYWISRLASKYVVSRQVILRKVFDLRIISEDEFKRKYLQYKIDYAALVRKKEEIKKKNKGKKQGGGEPVASQVVRNYGATYVLTVLDAKNNSKITDYKAAEYFGGIKATHLGEIQETFSWRYERQQ